VRRRNALLPTVAIVAFLVVGFLVFSNIWVDKLWFGALGYPDVFATMLWTRVALFVIFGAVLAGSLYLGLTARRLFRTSAELPDERNEHDARLTRGMTVLSSVQGVLILVSAAVLWLLGLWMWILPVVALIVALHFFPMPALFGRTVDYYLGTLMAIASLTGFTLAGMGRPWQEACAVTGIGGAAVTSLYGLYMVRTARKTLAQYETLVAAERE